MAGRQEAKVTVSYEYASYYTTPQSLGTTFGMVGVSSLPVLAATRPAVSPATLSTTWPVGIGAWINPPEVLGGWNLNIHHSYDSITRTLYLGNGGRLEGTLVDTYAGSGRIGYSGDGDVATKATFNNPHGAAFGPDGSLYIVDFYNNVVRRVGPDKIISTFAGNGVLGHSGDGGPATAASTNRPSSVAVDGDGNVYFTESNDIDMPYVRKVSSNGIISTFAGNGKCAYDGDNKPATQAAVCLTSGVAVGPDGSVYISDASNNRIRRVDPNGIISTYAGKGPTWSYYGQGQYGGDKGPAVDAYLRYPSEIKFGPDGSLYISDTYNQRIRKVSPDGTITTVAGNGLRGFSGDGGPATSASLNNPADVVISKDGSIYIADADNKRVRRVGVNGIITTVAGDGGTANIQNKQYPTATSILWPGGLLIGPDDNIYVVDSWSARVLRINSLIPGVSSTDIVTASRDGKELYVFNGSGLHQKTINAVTGAVLYSFTYDINGLLSTITDGNGNDTTIERDGQGNPKALVRV